MTKTVTAENTAGSAGGAIESLVQAYEGLLRSPKGFIPFEKGTELTWLRRAREREAARWREEGFPKRSSERWRYTNLNAIENSVLKIASLEVKPERSLFPCLPEAAIEIAFVNGVFVPEWSRLQQPAGVTVSVLSVLLKDCVENGWTKERLHQLKEFRAHLETSDADRETVFAAMNTSFLQDGVLVSVAPGAQLSAPIAIYNFTWAESSPNENHLSVTSPRVFVHVGRGAQASLAEITCAKGTGRSLSNSVCDLRLEDGARLSHARVQTASGENLQIGTTRVRQGRDSFCETYHFSLGGALDRHDLHVGLEGEGAEALLDGLYLVEGRDQSDNYTLVEHIKPHTTSSQLYKGILAGDSRAVFHGAVKILRDAQKASAAQLNKNLLMSAKAEVDTRPELEIDADDVKASHGATVGRIDPEQVFYLQARAVDKAEAERILARGFAMDIALRIRDAGLRKMIGGLVDARFSTFGGRDV